MNNDSTTIKSFHLGVTFLLKCHNFYEIMEIHCVKGYNKIVEKIYVRGKK